MTQINESDSSNLLLLEMLVSRAALTSDLCLCLSRIKLYLDNKALLAEIDPDFELFCKLEASAAAAYDAALDGFPSAAVLPFSRLSQAGRTEFWTNGQPWLAGDGFDIPWEQPEDDSDD